MLESVYSMDGDMCQLPEIVEVCKRHGARILIDEAHSTFLFGPNGRNADASVNFVTCHDGFTLNDLVSYNFKHNLANGQRNADGDRKSVV